MSHVKGRSQRQTLTTIPLDDNRHLRVELRHFHDGWGIVLREQRQFGHVDRDTGRMIQIPVETMPVLKASFESTIKDLRTWGLISPKMGRARQGGKARKI